MASGILPSQGLLEALDGFGMIPALFNSLLYVLKQVIRGCFGFSERCGLQLAHFVVTCSSELECHGPRISNHHIDMVHANRGPEDHVDIWILHSGSKAQDKGDSRNHDFW